MSFLNLFGGGDSTSSSSSTTEVFQTPTANANNGSSAVAAINSGSGTLNITSSDPAVTMHAMDTVLTMGQDALLFGADAQRQAYGFASDTTTKTLAFATENNQKTLEFANNTSQQAQRTAQTAIGSAETAYQRALKFGSEQTGVALDALAGSAQAIDTAYKDAKGVLGTNVILVAIAAGVVVMYFALGHRK